METRSSKAVADFFAVLLDEPVLTDQRTRDTVELQPLEKLLARVSDAPPLANLESESPQSPLIEPGLTAATAVVDINEIATKQTSSNSGQTVGNSPLTHNTLKEQMTAEFPVLYFKVADITMAVPLASLRAIYPVKTVTKLFGRPSWYSGIQVERGQYINVIDTAKYTMEEKYNSQVEQSLNYKYIIVLGNSNWGLLCEKLTGSSTLDHDGVKWRSKVARNPWLAGTVKQHLCGLLAVDALTQLLDDTADG